MSSHAMSGDQTSGDPWDRALPDGLVLRRTTRTFTQDDVPDGLLEAHRIAADVWGRLVVLTGAVAFTFEEGTDRTPRRIEAGGSVAIPPQVPHHVTIDGPVSFEVEFHTAPR